LGEYLDIHCGGVDNKFPHHTNEIAQTECYIGHKWCNNWFHVEHLNTKSGKMSKSSGEFLTLTRLNEMGYSPMVYKFFCLQSHYRKSLVFSFENLDNANSAYRKLVDRIAALQTQYNGEVDSDALEAWREKFAAMMGDDLNTSMAITLLYDVLKADMNATTKLAILDNFDLVLSLGLLDAAKKQSETANETSEDDAYIQEQIAKRIAAKKAKNFAEADAIRDALKAQGILLVDTAQGTTWKRA
jgi:cysteinyl-tRNA synthetase